MPTGVAAEPSGEGKQLAALAAPIAATQLAQIAVATTNIALMGTLGVAQLAAGGLALVLFNQIRTMCVGLVTGTGNQIAAVAARARDREVPGILRASFLIATAAGMLGAAALVGLGWALRWLGQDESVLAAARPMLLALAPGLLPALWFQVLRQYSVGMQRPQALLAVTLGSVAVNFALALGFLRSGWGLTGIGIATSVTYLVMLAVFTAMVRRDTVLGPLLPCSVAALVTPAVWRRMPPWRRRSYRGAWGPVDPAAVRAELRLGAPIALTYGSEAGMFSVLALVMGAIGPAALAAHNAVYQLVYIVFQIAVGLSHGASILVSKAVAAGEIPHARRLAGLALRQSALLVALVGMVYLLAPDAMLRLFTDRVDAQTTAIAHRLLLIAVVLQFLDAAQNIAVGLLRGVQDTAAGFRLSVIGYWFVGVPAALVLAFPLHHGAAGVWLGLCAGLAVTAALMLRRYFTLLDTISRMTHDVP